MQSIFLVPKADITSQPAGQSSVQCLGIMQSASTVTRLEQAHSSLQLTVMFLWAMCTSVIGGLTGIVVLWHTKMHFSMKGLHIPANDRPVYLASGEATRDYCGCYLNRKVSLNFFYSK